MSTWLTVVETEAYLSVAEQIMSDEERDAVVAMSGRDPQIGDLIVGTGGLRKVRVPLQGRGKRGGARLITFFHDDGMPAFLVAIYAKAAQSDLDPQQRRAAKRFTDAIPAEYGR